MEKDKRVTKKLGEGLEIKQETNGGKKNKSPRKSTGGYIGTIYEVKKLKLRIN